MPAPATDSQTTTLRRIGNSVGLTIPKDVLERAGLEEKTTVRLVETPDGLLLRKYDAEFEADWAAYQAIKQQYDNVFRELAK